jgi:hypothetical protein
MIALLFYEKGKWTENYSRVSNNNDLIQLKAELAGLLEEDAKADKLRSLPLYSCKITGWFKAISFVCWLLLTLAGQRLNLLIY